VQYTADEEIFSSYLQLTSRSDVVTAARQQRLIVSESVVRRRHWA